MAPISFDEVITRNVRGGRARAGLQQRALAARMRALGYGWLPQTVGCIERGERRVTAVEILGLAAALETSIAVLLKPTVDDRLVAFPSGRVVDVEFMHRSIDGHRDGVFRWDDEVEAASV